MTKVEISREALAAIKAHAATDPEHEVCGLLLGSGDRITAAAPARNIADDPRRRFEIDPTALFKALRRERAGGPGVLGYYHSHPHGPALPSATDQAMAEPNGKLWLIVGGAEVRAWRAGARGFEEVELSPSWR
ncbi:M67 family metallopeptidase [Sphingomonas sp. ID1715]|uniref:M67 family metallopeptidase n=1 Tax=Sphingomonas sp. ID1715 TaxID=1656898 RepID=UPI0034A02E38